MNLLIMRCSYEKKKRLPQQKLLSKQNTLGKKKLVSLLDLNKAMEE